MRQDEKKREYDLQYAREKLKQVKLVLNKEKDADLIVWLEKQENKQGYIKELIRKDMEENGSQNGSQER